MEPTEPIDDNAELVALLTSAQTTIVLAVRALMPGNRNVDDVVQQTNAKIWQKRSDFQRGTNFNAWVTAIARYEVLNFRKQQARDARIVFSDELEELITNEVSGLHDDSADRQRALQDCLKQLKAESRAMLMSRYQSDESLAEVAKRFGRTLGGMKVSLSHLRTSLLDCVQRRLKAEEGLV